MTQIGSGPKIAAAIVGLTLFSITGLTIGCGDSSSKSEGPTDSTTAVSNSGSPSPSASASSDSSSSEPPTADCPVPLNQLADASGLELTSFVPPSLGAKFCLYNDSGEPDDVLSPSIVVTSFDTDVSEYTVEEHSVPGIVEGSFSSDKVTGENRTVGQCTAPGGGTLVITINSLQTTPTSNADSVWQLLCQ